MREFSTLSLRRQLVLALLLLLLPLLGATLWSGVLTYHERVADLKDESLVVAATAAAWVDRELLGIERQGAALARAERIRRFDAAPATDLLQRALASTPDLGDLLLVRADGVIVARAGDALPSLVADEDWRRSVIASGRRTIRFVPGDSTVGSAGTAGGPAERAQTVRPWVIVAHPVVDDTGRAAGLLAQVVSLVAFQDAFAALPLPAGSVVVIRDEHGRTIARSIEPERYVGEVRPLEAAVSPADAPYERYGPDGVRRMYAEVVAAQGPWFVSVGLPMSVALDKAMSLWMRGFAVLAVGVAGWLIAAVVFSRRLTHAVSHLEAAARRIARGDYGPLEPVPPLSREFTGLQRAFESMLHQLRDTRQALDAQMAEERRIREELQSLQGQVIRQERLAAVGQLVSGVAHEINNPLQAILGFAELLQLQADVPEDAKADLRIIQKESTRACGIIRNLALFARQQPGEAMPIRLTAIITAVAELRGRRLESERIQLSIHDHSCQPVRAVPTELQQIVLNFLINAEQAIVGAGRLPGRITIRTFDRGEWVVLELEDTGPGVPPEHEARLFEPFFTTKPVGQGTGLGLSVSWGIVESLGGRIGHRRAPAGGAIFYIELPAAEGDVLESEEVRLDN